MSAPYTTQKHTPLHREGTPLLGAPGILPQAGVQGPTQPPTALGG